MRIVIKNTEEEYGKIVEVENTLKTFQEIVGGYIQTFPIKDDLLIVLNEEGKLLNLPVNFAMEFGNGYREIINGNIAIVSFEDDDFSGLTDVHLEILKRLGILEL